MADNAVALFKGAGLPSLDVGSFRQALTTAAQVITVASGTPFLKMLKQDGSWVYGANETEVQEGSQWAINPLSLKTGFVCWNPKGGKPLGQQMRSIFQTPPLLLSDMPDLGAPWAENVDMELQCLNGEDAGTAVQYTANSHGGKKAFSALIASMQKQLGVDQNKMVPVVNLTSDSYKSPQYGLIYNPIFEIVNWMTMAGPAAAEPAEEKVAEPEKPARRGRPSLNAVAQEDPSAGHPLAEPTPVQDAGMAANVEQPVQRTRRRRAAAA